MAMALLLICTTAGAEIEQDTLTHYNLEETVIMGERINRHNLTPASVSVVSGEDLNNLEINTISSLSGIIPNLFIPEYGSRQTRPVSIRGIMSKVKGNAVGYYIDGMPRFEVSSFDTDMLDIKSIEVFRGPQSTLYGRNTLGGVINVHTQSPFEYQGTKLRASYGNYNSINIQASHYNRINDNLALSIGGYYQHCNGYFTNEYMGKKCDPANSAGGHVGLYWKPGNDWTLRLTSNIDYINQGGYPYSVYDDVSGVLAPISYNRDCGYNRLLSTTGFMANKLFESFSFNSQTTFQHIHDNQYVDQDFTPQDVYYVTNTINNNVLSQEFSLKSETESNLQWVVGAYGSWQWYDQTQGTDYLKQGNSQVAHFCIPTTNLAVYGQLSYNFWKGLSATVGLRYDYERSSQDYIRTRTLYSDGSNSVINSFQSSMHGNEFIPKFCLQYKFDNRKSIFANISRGYKAGGFNASIQNDEDRTYSPEYNWNYELGIKYQNTQGTFGFDITGFYIDWKNQHISRTVAGLGNIIYNAGHSDSKGVEINLIARPVKGLVLQGGYGYTCARFIEYRKSETQDYSGNNIPMVPENTLSVSANYTIEPKGWLDRMTFNINTVGVGRLYWLEDNQVSQPFYALLGAKVSLAKGPVTLEIWGKNLTNTQYLSYYFVSSGKYAQQGVPTTFGGTISVQL